MIDMRSSGPVSPEHLRELLQRHGLATRRLRELVGRTHDIAESEMAAIAHLSFGRALTPGELGGMLALSPGGMTVLLHRLLERQYVTRAPHPDDKRSCLLSPTPRAATEVGGSYGPMANTLDRLARTLSEHERTVIATYLDAATALTRETTETAQRDLAERHHDRVVPHVPELWA